MAGTAVTVEERTAQITARVRELEGYESRAKAARVNKDDATAEKWDNRAQQVRDDLRAWGHDAAAPHARAAKRVRADVETR